MSINTLYRNYFQKSKIFVYPLLDIKKGQSVTPVQTYFGWNDYVTPEDMKLVAVYHERTDAEYVNFEKNILLKHNRLSDFVKLNDTEVLYTFDFSDIGDDWMNLINGRYSKMNPTIGRCIIKIIGNIHLPNPCLEIAIPPNVPPTSKAITPKVP
jgi:hypothetical protein